MSIKFCGPNRSEHGKQSWHRAMWSSFAPRLHVRCGTDRCTSIYQVGFMFMFMFLKLSLETLIMECSCIECRRDSRPKFCVHSHFGRGVRDARGRHAVLKGYSDESLCSRPLRHGRSCETMEISHCVTACRQNKLTTTGEFSISSRCEWVIGSANWSLINCGKAAGKRTT